MSTTLTARIRSTTALPNVAGGDRLRRPTPRGAWLMNGMLQIGKPLQPAISTRAYPVHPARGLMND